VEHWLMATSLETFIGAAAAFCTTASYIPQLRKCWTTGETGDLSLKMLLLLAGGLSLWMIYGLMRGDAVIVLANGVSLALLGCILYFKVRETFGSEHRHKATQQAVVGSFRGTPDARQSAVILKQGD
jgi:MtN3 and saliva related transmembrane protein